jgi:hypothetical protein
MTSEAPATLPFRMRDRNYVKNMIAWTAGLDETECKRFVLVALSSLHHHNTVHRVKALLAAVGVETGDGDVPGLARATLSFGAGASAFWVAAGDDTRAAQVQGQLMAVGIEFNEHGVPATDEARERARDIATGASGAGFWPATGDDSRAARVESLLKAVGIEFNEHGVPATDEAPREG